MADNLELQGGTWHVRLAIPKDVQKAFDGRKILSQSLKTGSRREAMTLRLPIISGWKSAIKTARAGVPLPEGWQDTLVKTIDDMDAFTRRLKLERIGEPVPPMTPIDPAEVERIMNENPQLIARLREEIARRRTEHMGMFNLDNELGGMFKQFASMRLNERHKLSADQQAEVATLISDPASRKARSPITPARVAAYRTFRESRGGGQKHIDQQVGKMERLSDFLQKESLPLEFDSVDRWLQSLDRAPNTLGQYVMAGTAFWKWAIKYDAGLRVDFKDKANPFIGHDLPQGGGTETAGKKRQIFAIDDVRKLHQAAMNAGNVPLADLILLGWYTGARIEELCRLRKVDVITVDAVRCFDIQRGKNDASERVVPIHEGAWPIVERLIADSADDYLIPVTGKIPYGKRSHALSKAFGRLRTALGYGPLHVFHSFRHTVVTFLIRAGVADGLVKELVGHDADDVTRGVYSKGSSVVQKVAALENLPLVNP